MQLQSSQKFILLIALAILLLLTYHTHILRNEYTEFSILLEANKNLTYKSLIWKKTIKDNETPLKFISPITIKQACDFHYGDLPQPGENLLTAFSAEKLFHGSVVFVDSRSLPAFIEHELSKIKVSFTIVSGDGDDLVGKRKQGVWQALMHALGFNGDDRYNKLLSRLANHPLLNHWFSMNCGMPVHPSKFSCIPNGISQWNNQRQVMAKFFSNSSGVMKPFRSTNKKRMALASFDKASHKSRRSAWNVACKLSNSLCYFDPTKC